MVRHSGNRFPVSAVPAVGAKGRTHFTVLTERFTAEVRCRLPDRPAGHVDRRVHLAVDGTPPAVPGRSETEACRFDPLVLGASAST
ncbi:hypothetical protein GCM10010421_21940 [Streptomyces glaucus]|uniref:Transposase n=1 Tax=Streptomyces glaucus TaxID=284029 RepID=A0ABN3JMN7_9ACTN